MNHRLKYLLCLSWTLVLGTALFTACSDDDDFTEEGGEELYMEARPVEDEIKTTVSTPYAVLGGSYDEMTTLLLRRMTGTRYDVSSADSYLPDDVRTIFINNSALVNISEGMVKQIKKLFDNGASIYLHKPNSLALAFFYMAMYGELEQAMEDMKDGIMGNTRAAEEEGDHDSFVMHRDQRNHEVLDIHNNKPRLGGTMTTVTYDEEGNEISSEETTLDDHVYQQPTEYEYGFFAEGVAQWLNEQEEWEHSATTRATTDSDELNSPATGVIQLPCKIVRAVDNKEITWNVYLRYWISSLYNFDTNEDYYHILLEEEYNGSACYAGEYYMYIKDPGALAMFKKGFISGKAAAGYQYVLSTVNALFCNQYVNDNEGYTVKDQWNPQPENEGITSTKETVNQWTQGQEVSFSKSGVTAKLSANHIYKETVSETSHELAVHLITDKEQSLYEWTYTANGGLMSYTASLGFQQGWFEGRELKNVPKENSIRRNRFTNRQSWNWLISDTKKRKDTPFVLNLYHYHLVQGASIIEEWPGGFPTYKSYNHIPIANQQMLKINLPVLRRYKHNYSFSSNPMGALSGDLRTALRTEVQDYKEIEDNPTQTDVTEEKLRLSMSKRWGQIAKSLEGREVKNTSSEEIAITMVEDYGIDGGKGSVMEMKDEKGEVIGTQLVIPAQSEGVIYIK